MKASQQKSVTITVKMNLPEAEWLMNFVLSGPEKEEDPQYRIYRKALWQVLDNLEINHVPE